MAEKQTFDLNINEDGQLMVWLNVPELVKASGVTTRKGALALAAQTLLKQGYKVPQEVTDALKA